MATQAERSEAMRARLIEVGLRLFAEGGYEATSTDALLREARASKGALYHHFEGKQALFEAIFEQVARASIERALLKPPRAASPLEALIDASLRWLGEARRPDVARILLEEGPRVLGFARARDLEAKYSLGVVTRGLQRAMDVGELELPDVGIAARLINAALAEAALMSLGTKRGPSRAKVDATIRKLLEGLAH